MFNLDALNRLLAGALALVNGNRQLVQDNEALRAENADLKQRLGESQAENERDDATIAAQSADTSNANEQISRVADEVEKLVQGPELPEAPVAPAPEEAAEVVAGETPVQAPEATETVEFAPAESGGSESTV